MKKIFKHGAIVFIVTFAILNILILILSKFSITVNILSILIPTILITGIDIYTNTMAYIYKKMYGKEIKSNKSEIQNIKQNTKVKEKELTTSEKIELLKKEKNRLQGNSFEQQPKVYTYKLFKGGKNGSRRF